MSAILTIFKFFNGLRFIIILGFRVILGISQTRFFSVWVFIELNILAFLVLVGTVKNVSPSSPLKYFLVQRLGSSVFLLGLILGGHRGLTMTREAIVSLRLFLKLGVAPFHGWFIRFIRELDWKMFFVSSTIQKVLPLFLAQHLYSWFSDIVILVRALARVIGRVNQLIIKKILAYSSVFTAAWLMRCQKYFHTSLHFLLIYGIALGVLVCNTIRVEEKIEGVGATGTGRAFVICISLIRIGGVPPLVGFYAKASVIALLLDLKTIFILLRLVLRSIILLYVYMRVFFSIITLELLRAHSGLRLKSFHTNLVIILRTLILILPFSLRKGVGHKKIWTFRS